MKEIISLIERVKAMGQSFALRLRAAYRRRQQPHALGTSCPA